jgi:hypothetical protein
MSLNILCLEFFERCHHGRAKGSLWMLTKMALSDEAEMRDHFPET